MPDFFDILGVPPSFDMDVNALEAAYFNAQRQYHPDRFIGKLAAEKLAALQKSADINQAYETLKNPLKRAQYLLHMQGIRVGTEADSVKPSQAILVEVMELREGGVEAPVLEKLIIESIDIIRQKYHAVAFDAMAQEVIRLGYLLKMQHDVR